jgi:hypothetical protein
MPAREIDPATNYFYKCGYDDAMRGIKFNFPDECRTMFHYRDYNAGYDAGQTRRGMLDQGFSA